MRMRRRMLRSQQNHEFVARPADIARADGEDGVPWASLLEQELDAFLHRTKIMDVLVPGVANGARKRFAGYARDGRFASRINVEQHEDVRLIERTAEFIPKVLSARITMRLEEHKQAIELASAGRFERGANFGGVMAIVVTTVMSLTTPLISKRRPTPANLARPSRIRSAGTFKYSATAAAAAALRTLCMQGGCVSRKRPRSSPL